MITSVIVHGPQGCGKTRNKAALQKHFKCERTFDDAHFSSNSWLKSRATEKPTLFLSNEIPGGAELSFRHVKVVAYADALQEMLAAGAVVQ